MSTVATQLNWGASYLVNDVYRRFSKRRDREALRRRCRGWATVVLFLLSTLVTWQLSSVEGAWKFLLAIGAGTGLVLILRWYWWRINAWSEISSMLASFAISLICFKTVPGRWFPADDPRTDSVIMLITVVAEHGDLGLRHVHDRAGDGQRARRRSTSVFVPAGRDGRSVSDAARVTAASRFPVARWRGRTGWRASSRCTRRCSGSGRSSSARWATALMLLCSRWLRSAGSPGRFGTRRRRRHGGETRCRWRRIGTLGRQGFGRRRRARRR